MRPLAKPAKQPTFYWVIHVYPLVELVITGMQQQFARIAMPHVPRVLEIQTLNA